MVKKFFTTSALAIALVATGGVGAAQAATPTVVPAGTNSLCSSSNWDVGVSQVARKYVKGNYRISGSPGTTLSIAVGTSSSVTGTVSVSATAEAGAIFAKASVTAGVSLAVGRTVTAQYTATATVPASGGYLELGAEGRSFAFVAKRYNNNCVLLEQHTGTGLGVTTTPYALTSWGGFK